MNKKASGLIGSLILLLIIFVLIVGLATFALTLSNSITKEQGNVTNDTLNADLNIPEEMLGTPEKADDKETKEKKSLDPEISPPELQG